MRQLRDERRVSAGNRVAPAGTASADQAGAPPGKLAPQPLFRDPVYGGANGGYPGVVVSGDRAYCFDFLPPGCMGTIQVGAKDGHERRRRLIQVVELKYEDGRIPCDRDQPTYLNLLPPINPPHL
jgi:hypothetical protein